MNDGLLHLRNNTSSTLSTDQRNSKNASLDSFMSGLNCIDNSSQPMANSIIFSVSHLMMNESNILNSGNTPEGSSVGSNSITHNPQSNASTSHCGDHTSASIYEFPDVVSNNDDAQNSEILSNNSPQLKIVSRSCSDSTTKQFFRTSSDFYFEDDEDVDSNVKNSNSQNKQNLCDLPSTYLDKLNVDKTVKNCKKPKRIWINDHLLNHNFVTSSPIPNFACLDNAPKSGDVHKKSKSHKRSKHKSHRGKIDSDGRPRLVIKLRRISDDIYSHFKAPVSNSDWACRSPLPQNYFNCSDYGITNYDHKSDQSEHYSSPHIPIQSMDSSQPFETSMVITPPHFSIQNGLSSQPLFSSHDFQNLPQLQSCTLADGRSFSVGNIVWAKIQGYPFWPSRIVKIARQEMLAPNTNGKISLNSVNGTANHKNKRGRPKSSINSVEYGSGLVVPSEREGYVIEYRCCVDWLAWDQCSYLTCDKLFDFVEFFDQKYSPKNKKKLYVQAVEEARRIVQLQRSSSPHQKPQIYPQTTTINTHDFSSNNLSQLEILPHFSLNTSSLVDSRPSVSLTNISPRQQNLFWENNHTDDSDLPELRDLFADQPGATLLEMSHSLKVGPPLAKDIPEFSDDDELEIRKSLTKSVNF